VVRIPSFTRRSETTSADEDVNRDGRIDERDDRAARREQVDDRGTYRSRSATGTVEAPADVRERRAEADRASAERAAAERASDRAEASRLAAARTREDEATERLDRERPAEPAPTGPRPRSSMMATLGLIVGVASALAVLTGTLAGYGVALAVIGLFLSIFGMAATGKRHVAGKSDATLGALFSIGAMVVGALALTGSLDWLTTETNKVDQLRGWLDTHLANRF
jgi:hypothetical protein